MGDLAPYLETLIITSGFDDVTSLGIVRDAEEDATTAFRSVCGSLGRARLSVPKQPMVVAGSNPKVSVFILPDCSNSGMLETLCLQTISNDPIMSCIDQYFQCVQNQTGDSPGNLPKAKVHAFLASRPTPGLLLGQASHAGYWAWENPIFDDIKQFLKTL
ncbi:MAG: DUF3226 domain-containing protein [Candidatus Bipolaricaulia bacterium]